MKQPRKNAEERRTVLNKLHIFFNTHAKTLALLCKAVFVVLIVIISIIAFLPNYNDLPEFTSFSDVLNHFFAFLVLTFFLEHGFSPKRREVFLLLFLYGFFIEAVQHFLPNRVFDLLDIAVDMVGVGFYYAGKSLLRRE